MPPGKIFRMNVLQLNWDTEPIRQAADAHWPGFSVEVLPQVAKEVAAPMAAIEKLTVISTDGAGAMPKQVTNNVVQTMELIKNATGVDLTKMLSKYGEQATQPSKPHAVEPLADTDE